jgi:tetratricopeptide (TPR) repeat protein
MARRIALTIVLVTMGALGTAPRALAQDAPADGDAVPSASHDAEARALFQAGSVAFNDGRFEDALSYFTRSHELSGRPELLYNIGTTQDRLRREPEAVSAFEAYLEAVPDAHNRREVEGRLRVLREEIAREADAERARARDATTAPVTDAPSSEPVDRGESGGGEDVITSWWLWTIIGVVVAGAVVGAVVATQTTGGDTYPDLLTGSDGTVVFTLTVPMP